MQRCTSETWTRNLDPDPDKRGRLKTWTLKNLNPEKHGPKKTLIWKNMKPGKYGVNMGGN